MAFPTLGSPGATGRPGGLASLRRRRQPVEQLIERGIDLEIRQQQANELSMIRQKEMAEFMDELNRRNLQTSPKFTSAVATLLAPDLDLTSDAGKRALGEVFAVRPELAGNIVERIQNLRVVEARLQDRQSRVPLSLAADLVDVLGNTPQGQALNTAIENAVARGENDIDRNILTTSMQGAVSLANQAAISGRHQQDLVLAQGRLAVSQQNAISTFMGRELDIRKFNTSLDQATRKRAEERLPVFIDMATQIMSAGLRKTQTDELASAAAIGAELGGLAHSIQLASPEPIPPMFALAEAMRMRPDLTPPGLAPGAYDSVINFFNQLRGIAGLGGQAETPAAPPGPPSTVAPVGTPAPAPTQPTPGFPRPGASGRPAGASPSRPGSAQVTAPETVQVTAPETGQVEITDALRTQVRDFARGVTEDTTLEDLQKTLRDAGQDLTIEQVQDIVQRILSGGQ